MAQAVGHVIGDVPARHRQDGRVPHRAVDEDRQVGRAAADVHHHHAHLALGGGQDHVAGGQWVQDEAVHVHAGRFDALLQVLDGRRRRRDDVRLHFQPEAVHAQRAAHALVAVQAVAARNDVQDLAVVRDGDGPRILDGALHVLVLDGPHPADPGDAPAVDRRDLVPGHAHEGAPDLVAAAALRLVHGGRNRRRQGVHVGDHALLHAAARRTRKQKTTKLARRGICQRQVAYLLSQLVPLVHWKSEQAFVDAVGHNDTCRQLCSILSGQCQPALAINGVCKCA